jgi:hypothetical protein
MLTETSRRVSESQSSLDSGSRRLIGGCSVILAMVSILAVIEMPIASAWFGAAPAGEMVNRTEKRDRLPLFPAFHQNPTHRPAKMNVLRIPAADQALIDGCESLASPLARSPLAQIAGRCLS